MATSPARCATDPRHARLGRGARNTGTGVNPPNRLRRVFSWLYALALAIGLIFVLSELARAGGPRYVAGTSFFNPEAKGTALTWAQGSIRYYSDQGNLSSLLTGPSADAFVADAFSRWTSIPTAAISATRGGQLAEDVNSSNVFANGDGTITLPSDILLTAVNQPVAVVYDADGSVTDALVGQGASAASFCFTNAVLGGPDNFSPDAHLLHALVILNGNCAQTSAQLPDLKYHLVRVLGQVLGLDWSQLNVNVVAGNPAPSAADYAGFPVMHAADPSFCVPVSKCYPAGVDPSVPKMDDEAALSRLYPVTALNQSNFPGKQIFSGNTVRIHGSVYFEAADGTPAQPMQGVNVVARWVDPITNLPSRTYAAASVSGFSFHGNAGNPVSGFDDATGQPYGLFGSDDPTVEGFFDLAGLQIPDGTGQAEFELSVEGVDPLWSNGMQPYGSLQVKPSGTARLFVFANQGQDIQQDIMMQASAVGTSDSFGATSYAAPAPVPATGDWVGTLNPYGDSDYFQFSAQANRTLSVSAIALDESGAASNSKAQPVIGIWSLATPAISPATVNTPSALNTQFSGETRLDAAINATTNFRIGISDFRGDGRPDFRYHARVLYTDSVSPARAGVGGGTPLLIRGVGFHTGDAVSLGGTSVSMLALSANQIVAVAPGAADGVQNITLSDANTGGASTMTAALTYGAGPNDTIQLISGAIQQAPIGGQAPNPIVVQVVAPDGTTPVAGASVFLTSTPATALTACGGGSTCTVLTDQSGMVSTYATVLTAGVIAITSELAPASYNPPQQIQVLVNGTSSPLDIALTPQSAWIAKGATLSLPLTARVLSHGTPLAGRVVNYQVLKGPALLTSTSVTTNAAGSATSTLQLSSLSGDVQVSACVQNLPVDNPCLSFNATAVPASGLPLQLVAGSPQVVPVGQNFLPLAVRAVTAAAPVHAVRGASVVFQSLVARAPQNSPVLWIGDTGIGSYPMPVILSSSQVTVQTDNSGLATLTPSSGGIQGPILVLGTAFVGTSSLQFTLESLPPVAGSAQSTSTQPRSNLRQDPSAR